MRAACVCSDLKPGGLAGLSWVKRSPRLANRTRVSFVVPRRRMKCHFRRSVNCFCFHSRPACPCRRLPLSARNRRPGGDRGDLISSRGEGGETKRSGATSGNACTCVCVCRSEETCTCKHRFQNTKGESYRSCEEVGCGVYYYELCASGTDNGRIWRAWRSFGIKFGGNLTDLAVDYIPRFAAWIEWGLGILLSSVLPVRLNYTRLHVQHQALPRYVCGQGNLIPRSSTACTASNGNLLGGGG